MKPSAGVAAAGRCDPRRGVTGQMASDFFREQIPQLLRPQSLPTTPSSHWPNGCSLSPPHGPSRRMSAVPVQRQDGPQLPGRGGSYLPPLPQIRTCPVKASGSSRYGLTDRCATRGSCGDAKPKFKALVELPSHGSITRHPPSHPQGPCGKVPLLHRYYEGVRLPPPVPSRFVVLRLTVPLEHSTFAPHAAE